MTRRLDIAFRADASSEIGSGHVMRCLTLADELAARGERVAFVTRDLPGHLGREVRARGHQLFLLPRPQRPGGDPWLGTEPAADAAETHEALRDAGRLAWLVDDGYGFDAGWERTLRSNAYGLCAIDDLADRPHDCDVLVDQTLADDRAARYASLVEKDCTLLLGPRYALLRAQFATVPRRARDGRIDRLLVFFGGADDGTLALRALAAIEDAAGDGISADVVLSPSAARFTEVTVRVAQLPHVTVHGRVDDMAALMNAADLTIGAGGGATWERCALGLPALTVTMADNQVEQTVAVQARGACRYLGPAEDVLEDDMAEALRDALRHPEQVRAMSEAASAIIPDACGAERVADELQTMRAGNVLLRPMREGDLDLVRGWRNSERVRPFMVTRHEIGREEHEQWFGRVRRSPASRHLVFELDGRPLGVVNLTRIDRERGTCDWGFYIGAPDAPSGAGTLMGELALAYANERLGVDEVNAEVLRGNTRSLDYHSKLGFVERASAGGMRGFTADVRDRHARTAHAREDAREVGDA